MRDLMLFPVLSVLILTGCPAEKKQMPAVKEAEEKPAEKPAEKAPAKPAVVAGDPECFGPWTTDGPPSSKEANDKTYEITGAKLVEKSTDDDTKTVLGVMANLKEDTADNLANIEAFLKVFDEAKVDAILVVGDLGESRSQIENVMKPLADSGHPVFAVIGNRERKSHFNEALAAFSDKPVFNMNKIRLAALDDVALVSIPGYYDRAFIHAEEGCHYRPEDLEATKPIIAAANGKPVILVSHGGPKQEGPEALDRTQEQANVGDPALTKLIRETGVKLGIFSNIHESGGKATDLTGTKLVPEKTPAEELYLNPGAVDAVSWPMNDGTRSVGMAGILTIDGGKASYEIHRMKEGA